MKLQLIQTSKFDHRLGECMASHYSKPNGFVGRSICYAILFDKTYYGHIVAGSATRFLPGRNDFFQIDKSQLNNIINNTFFHVFRVNGNYPVRNFTKLILCLFIKQSALDWVIKYGDEVIGFETLVELPRTGELYLRSGWSYLGQTKGYTCKRVGGKGTDSWTGKRVWDTKNLRPKSIFAIKVDPAPIPEHLRQIDLFSYDTMFSLR